MLVKEMNGAKEIHISPVPINSNIKVGNSGKFFPLATLIAFT